MTEAIPEPEWFAWATGEPPTVLCVWDGAATLFLSPTDRGAIVWWEFDQDEDDSIFVLVAHLSNDEAQAVFAAPPNVGALEPVRARMVDDRALVVRRRPSGRITSILVRVPRTVPESEFSTFLDHLCDALTKADRQDCVKSGASWDNHADESRQSRLDTLARLVSA